MTTEQILKLAENYFDYQGGWIAYSKEDLLKFALAIHENGYNKGYDKGYDEGWESSNVSTKMNTWSSDDD